MKTLELNGQKITDTFQYVICEDNESAIKMGVEDYGWNENDILDRTEKVSVKLENGEIVDTELSCIMVDSGSEDYIFYL